MEHVDELGTEDGIRGCETTARKDTQLQHLCNGAVFCDSYIGREGEVERGTWRGGGGEGKVERGRWRGRGGVERERWRGGGGVERWSGEVERRGEVEWRGGEGEEQEVKLNRKEQISWFHTNTLRCTSVAPIWISANIPIG